MFSRMHVCHAHYLDGQCYSFFTETSFFMDLSNFLHNFIVLFQTSNHKENLYKISLTSCSSHFHMCLPHGKPYGIKLNFILDSSFLCCTWLCCHIHVHHTCHASLPFCHHHAVASCSPILICLLWTVSVDPIQTCTYNMIVYSAKESTGIPSLILLEFHF